MPVLALRGLMVFPHMVLHFDVGRPKSVAALQEAMMNDQKIFLVAQKDVDDPDPTPENLCTVGTIANIRQVMNLPGDSLRVLVEGETRGELTAVTQEDPFLLGRIHLPKVTAPADEMELAALVRTAKDYFDAYARASQRVSQETIASIRDVDDAEQIADLIAANILTKLEDRQQILEEFDIQRRLERLCTILSREIELTGVEKQVQERVKKQIDKNQKDYYLREHMKAIQTELGDTDATDVEELRERAKNTPLNDEARQRVDKELERLSRMTPGTPEVGMSRTYIEWILDLPWGKQTTDNLDLKRARKVLAQDHYGLEKVKERIVEYLAVLKLKQDMRGPILCFVGPPGVGKTSIVRAIAKAVGRQFVQVSLGGVRDEAEIRGHRRTYIGAIPGRIISGMKQAGTMNPVFLFDEIDKMSHDFRGDPASAMLEVLDGEQNGAFRDHYLELPFDLSRVMFITTANTLDTIPRPLLDRMEIIRLDGYTEQEKIEIAKRHLIPKVFKENAIKPTELFITDDAIRDVIRYYTSESGVRNLERELATIARKSAKELLLDSEKKAEKGGKSAGRSRNGTVNEKTANEKTAADEHITVTADEHITVTPDNLNKYLGIKKFHFGVREEKNLVGVTTGLAWTEVGGDILFIEAVDMPGKGVIKQTGKLGEVMKESIDTAYSVVRSHAQALGINPEVFEKTDVHVHVPEGAIPKDGPSAGITMATSLASALTQKKVKANLAMTGEITLRGKVLPVGGIKEKILAAKRAGIKEIILSDENRKNIEEIQDIYLKGLTFHYVKDIKEVFAIALTDEKVADAIDLSVKKEKTEKKEE